MIAVDAPTLIPNLTGMRLPDKLTHQYFHQYHAGCYPANLGRPFAQRTVEFGLSLEARGFTHAPVIVPKELGRFQIEVFPHPAIVHLFGLTRILKYKKGTLAERRLELIKLRQYILDILPTLEPTLNLCASSLPEIPTTRTALKAVEDQLDSLICAYVAAHWWYWGIERNWVLGDASTGYIVVPAPAKSVNSIQC
jgi:predicted RNase H-like nuclease